MARHQPEYALAIGGEIAVGVVRDRGAIDRGVLIEAVHPERARTVLGFGVVVLGVALREPQRVVGLDAGGSPRSLIWLAEIPGPEVSKPQSSI